MQKQLRTFSNGFLKLRLRSLVLMLQVSLTLHLHTFMVSNHIIIIGANRGGNVKCGQDVAAASPCSSHSCAMNLK